MVCELSLNKAVFKRDLGLPQGFLGGSDVKNLPASAGDSGSILVYPLFPWRRKWQPSPVFLSGKFHGQRSLVSYSPWGSQKKSDTS